MSNASNPPIERQAATTSIPCASCVKAGFACSCCCNLFLIGDLRTSHEGAFTHWWCDRDGFSRGLLRPGNRCDVLTLPDDPPPTDEEKVVLRAGETIADKVTRLAAAKDATLEDRVMTTILVEGYLRACLPEGRPDHHDHVGSHAPTTACCDFCSAPEAAGKIDVTTFWSSPTGAPGEMPLCYEGAWTYCSFCAADVRRGDHVALAERALRQRAPHIVDPARRRSHFEGLYKRVMKLRR